MNEIFLVQLYPISNYNKLYYKKLIIKDKETLNLTISCLNNSILAIKEAPKVT